MLIEAPRYTLTDAVYMTIITISTAGHMEAQPLSAGGRLWTVFVILSGVITAAIFLSLLAAMVVEGQVRRILGRRQLEHKINNLRQHVIVCGYGHMGEMITAELKSAGIDVVVIDKDPERTSLLEGTGLLYVLGDAQDDIVLGSAGLSQASALISALPTDAENVLVVLTARQGNAEISIITRAKQTASERKMLQAGATRVVCPQVMGASRIVNIVLRPAVVDFFEVANKGVDLEMDQIVLDADSELVGKSLKDLELPRRAGVHVAAIRRADGQTVYRPASNVSLEVGDTVILFGQSGAAASLASLRL